MTLRSHSRGTLARYKGKIEHQRVLQGGLGQALLARLVGDRILKLDGKFYYWVPEVAATSVGISWHQLNARATSPLLTEYLTRFIRAHSDA